MAVHYFFKGIKTPSTKKTAYVVSLDRLLLMRVLAMDVPKYMDDLKLIKSRRKIVKKSAAFRVVHIFFIDLTPVNPYYSNKNLSGGYHAKLSLAGRNARQDKADAGLALFRRT